MATTRGSMPGVLMPKGKPYKQKKGFGKGTKKQEPKSPKLPEDKRPKQRRVSV